MDQNVNYYGIILLLRQLRESGSFSEKELRRVAARIAADSGADIMMSFPLEAAKQRAGLDAARHPRMIAFIDRVHARPAYRRALEKGGPYSFA